MAAITKPTVREIVDDFAREIQGRRTQTAKPSKTVINFRTDLRDGIERIIYKVPIGLLRFRKENGRIASDVADHERNVGPIDERDDRGQQIIAKFLFEKDRERTAVLRSSIIHAGQQEPAIITCDGFLINGNRRKMVMDRLHAEQPQSDNFAWMKCVILPGKDEEGGAPTLLEIEKIENRYQLQSDGKSEYYGFDRALSIQRKILIGLSLEEQLRDDPQYSEATRPQMEKALREYTKQFIDPLQCVDRYLKQFKREGLYRTISQGMSDPEGRWQAFIDYSSVYNRTFLNPKQRIELGIEEDEVGSIEEAAFNIIRLRAVPDMPKVHVIMRDLAKYCGTKEGKREIIKISEEVEPLLPAKENTDEHGNALSLDTADAKWAAKYKTAIVHRLKKARSFHESQRQRETPIDLLQAALGKLAAEGIDVRSITAPDLAKARALVVEIQTRAREIEAEIYRIEKEFKKLLKKSS